MNIDRLARSRSDGLDAYAVFERGPNGDSAPNVEVVVKRKRTLQAGADATLDRQGSAEEASVREPRVFRVDAPVQPPVERFKDLPTVPRLRTRRRRVPRGEVKIIRPAATASSSTPLEHKSETEQPTGLGLSDFGVAPEEKSRYTKLMTEISRLERQAKAAKETEAAAAVSWIRKAIADYGITADDLSLRA